MRCSARSRTDEPLHRNRLVGAAALWLGAIVLGEAAHAQDTAPYPQTVDELAAALQDQHVIVQQSMGSGDAAGTVERLAAIAGQMDFTTYVALVSPPEDIIPGVDGSRLLTTSLARQLGPGLYVVRAGATAPDVVAWDIGLDRTRFSLQVSTNADAVADAAGTYSITPSVLAEVAARTALNPGADDDDYVTVSLAEDQIGELADRDAALQPYERPKLPDEDPDDSWTPGKRAMVGTVTGLSGFMVVWLSLRGWPGWRRRRSDEASSTTSSVPAAAPPTPTPVPSVDQARQAATARVDELSQALSETEVSAVKETVLLDRALLAATAAGPLLESRSLLDLIGADVVARTGLNDLARATGTTTHRWYACFFNPLHDDGVAQVSWRFGQADVAVRACLQCRRAFEAGATLDVLTPPRFGPDQPYYRTDTVWARTGFGTLVDNLAADVLADPRRRAGS